MEEIQQTEGNYTGSSIQVLEGLDPETKYVVVALAADADGVCSGEACKAEFKTAAVPQSANKITLAYANGKINRQELKTMI